MNTNAFGRLILILCALVALGAEARAQLTPQQKAEARKHYDAGSRKFDVGEYDSAAEEFKAAYEIVGDPVILYNIAQSYRLAQKHDLALRFYKTYLRKVPDTKNRAEVESRIEDLTRTIAEQKRVTEAPPTGIVKPTDGNEHEQTSTREKGRVATREKPTVETPPVEKRTEPVTPPPTENNPPPTENNPPITTPPPVAKQPVPVIRIVGFALAGVTVVALAAGIALIAIANGDAKDVVNAANMNPSVPWSSSLQGKYDNSGTLGTAGIALTVVGGVAAAGTAVCLWLGFRKQPSSHASIAPLFDPHGGGLVVLGRF